MRVEIHRTNLIIVPENDQDKAFIEDTLALKSNADGLTLKRVEDVQLGFNKKDSYVLKSEGKA